MTLSSCAEHYLNPNWTVCAPALMAILDAAEQEGAVRRAVEGERERFEADLCGAGSTFRPWLPPPPYP